jgi:hypothetical protein
MSFEDAFGSWHRERDSKVLPAYAFTTHQATLEPPPPETQQLLGAIYGNQAAMDDFVSVNAGTLRQRCSSLQNTSAGPLRPPQFRASREALRPTQPTRRYCIRRPRPGVLHARADAGASIN